ncbi:MAG: sigma-54-dependent Fis family transcriptional regulator [Hymenobacter sp.]|nr:MAG: sigma-54-dependent Fis family transcriptional regulator [Hymenobacter sp.]
MLYEVLIIDDELDIRDLISDALEDDGYKTTTASDSLEAFKLINQHLPDVVILDIWLQGSELDGLGILEVIKDKYPSLPVIMISGHGTIETAVNAIKIGAYDYIEKPFDEDKLLVTVKRACDLIRILKQNNEFKIDNIIKTEFIGSSSASIQLKNNIDKVALTTSRILITGEPGTGKELVARLIHKKSKRCNEIFVNFNCCNVIDQENIDLELFGDTNIPSIYDKARKIGAIEKSNFGTLFLNEIGDLPLFIQNKLLVLTTTRILWPAATCTEHEVGPLE